MSLEEMSVEELCVNTIRTLAMDAVQQANSGHPGTPMALAPLAYVLYRRVMRHNPRNPGWFDRDRFVLSAGHASMLQYAALYLSGYGLTLDDIKAFRQWGSRTPGHPELHETPGVETTTGPLGQGIMNAVGMAMAEAHLAASFNRPGHAIVDHRTYVICSDGDLMEGASHEAASLAGHLGLGKLVAVYDDNRITIEGGTELALSDDVVKRFEGYHWNVIEAGEVANDVAALEAVLRRASSPGDRPTLVVLRSHIGFGAPTRQDTASAHGEPLGEAELAGAKRAYGWPEDARFLVPEAARAHMNDAIDRGRRLEEEWRITFDAYRVAHPDLAARFEQAQSGELPAGWDAELPNFDPASAAMATRVASGKVLVAVARKVPWLLGGSGDLAPSTKTLIESGDFGKGNHQQRNIHFGIREHAMAGCSNGMALHGGVRPYAATFFVFTDYARPSIRLAALMGLPVVYVMTHDSIGLGEDGPTHQPIEHLASLRAIPRLWVVRPADANETAFAWRLAMARRDGPTLLALTRQNLPVLAGGEGLLKGAYVVSPENGAAPGAILLATGSEVAVALAAQRLLAADGIDARVVSMPCWEAFRAQSAEYREQVLPVAVRARVAVEAAVPMGWHEWIGERGAFVGISDRFGASAPYQELYERLGITAAAVAAAARAAMSR